MPPEYTTGYVMLAAIVVLGAGFLFTALSARKGPDDYELIHHNGYLFRRYWFVGLMCLGLMSFGFTLPHMPVPMFRKPAGQVSTVVNVTGEQWSWTLQPSTVTAGQSVEFRVTSHDVNHGFGIFNSNGNIVGQVQAMPGFTNDLYYTFDKPGTYTIRCLELCGLYHTAMVSSLTVAPAGG
jgi:cytochrome c oxidase subunit 2